MSKRDRFQHIKGEIGKHLAIVYLRRRFDDLQEEVTVKGCKKQAKIDFVVREGETYRPVELKFQVADLESFGQAFESIIRRTQVGETSYSEGKGNPDGFREVRLEKPILIIWYPPARKLIDSPDAQRYAGVEVVPVADIVSELSASLGGYEELAMGVAQGLADLVKDYFLEVHKEDRFALTKWRAYKKRMDDFLRICQSGA